MQQYQHFKIASCILYVDNYPEEAKGFAEGDATQKTLIVAIASISKAIHNDSKRYPLKYDMHMMNMNMHFF